jgi:hypothetical protein
MEPEYRCLECGEEYYTPEQMDDHIDEYHPYAYGFGKDLQNSE